MLCSLAKVYRGKEGRRSSSVSGSGDIYIKPSSATGTQTSRRCSRQSPPELSELMVKVRHEPIYEGNKSSVDKINGLS